MNDKDREMQDTLRAANKRYAGKAYDPNYRKNEKKRMAGDRVVEMGRMALIALGLGLAALLIDGWRRDYGHVSTTLVAHRGSVNLSTMNQGKLQEAIPRDGTLLDVGAVLTSGPGSFATLAFPDGSAIRIESDGGATLKVMDFFRSGRRDRTVALSSGSAVIRHSANAGPGSLITVTTGDTVVAVRPGTLARVSTASGGATRAEVGSGSVVVRTAASRRELKPGQQAASDGTLSTIPDQRALKELGSALSRYETTPNFWTKTAASVTRSIDPLLQKIGITLQGWNPDKTDLTRRNAALSSLSKLGKILAMGEAPDTLNPVTLAEAGSPDETERLRKDFASMSIDSYQKIGTGYALRVRARDGQGTPFEMRNGKITGGK